MSEQPPAKQKYGTSPPKRPPAWRSSVHDPRKETSSVDIWRTVAVTALPPGWRAVHRGPKGLKVLPVAAVLLQELRSRSITTRTFDDPDRATEDVSTQAQELPYDTRVIVSRISAGGELIPDDEDTLIGVLSPDEDVSVLLPIVPDPA